MRIPFGTQSYQHTSLPLSAQRMVNCYLEPAPQHAKTLAAVIESFGVANLSTVATPYRGALLRRGTLYVVGGTGLYQVSTTGTATLLGTVSGTARVFMAGDEVNVVVNTPESGALWVWNGATFAQVTDSDFPGARWIGDIDGYVVFIAFDGRTFGVMNNRDPLNYDALDFASAESNPDDCVTGVIDHEEVVIFGTGSGQIFYDSGNADFPITKVQGGLFEVGCTAPFGPVKTDNGVVFPGHDGKVYKLNGYTPQVISTPVVEQAIANATDRDFIGMAWGEPGHSFYALKCADFAFVYDFSTQLWYERESYGYDSWRWAFVIRAYEKWIVGDAESSALGYLSPDTHTEFGATMLTRCASPPVGEDNKRVVHSRVELVFEQGVGLVTGQGSDPMVMLRFSDDGGRTWSNEKWRSMGAIGEYRRRTVWHRLGAARDRIYEYSISDPVRRTLILATTEARARAA